MNDRSPTDRCGAILLALALLTGCQDGESTAPNATRSEPVPPLSSTENDRPPAPEGTRATTAPSSAAAAQTTAGAVEAPTKAAPPATKNAPPQNITFDTIKLAIANNDEYSRQRIPSEIEALNGRAIKLRGYILPSFQQSGLTQFVLVRDDKSCCFGPGAALYDCVVVDMVPGKFAEFSVRPVAVEGKFELREIKGPDGKCLAIYHLDGNDVRF